MLFLNLILKSKVTFHGGAFLFLLFYSKKLDDSQQAKLQDK